MSNKSEFLKLNMWNTSQDQTNILNRNTMVNDNWEILDNKIKDLDEKKINYNDLNNKPINQLEGTEENPIIISDLENGLYTMKGYFKLNVTGELKNELNSKFIQIVAKGVEEKDIIINCGEEKYHYLQGKIEKIEGIKVIDHLEGTSPVDALSAKQGMVLNEKINTIAEKNIITAFSKNMTTQGIKWNNTPVSFTESIKIGDKLQIINNNSIKIGAGISKVKVSGCLSITPESYNGFNDITLILFEINGKNKRIITSQNANKANTYMTTFCLPPVLLEVEEGEYIQLTHYTHDATTNFTTKDSLSTYLTVEVVE